MNENLCLRWNYHTETFLKSFCTLQTEKRYCDATLICEGKYFPVHRLVLSTCSEYFDELFKKIQCPHPYIVFKEISAIEMELLLNYMYQGEINVVQMMLPSLIKAAESLQIKGLAVPEEDLLKEPSSRKRCLDESLETHDKHKRHSISPNEDNQDHFQSNSLHRDELSDIRIEHAESIKNQNFGIGESSKESLMFPETVMSGPSSFPDSNISIKQETSHDSEFTPEFKRNEQASSYQNKSIEAHRDNSSSLDGGGRNVTLGQTHFRSCVVASEISKVIDKCEVREHENPWPHLDKFISYKTTEGNNYIFQCKVCLPKQHKVRAHKSSYTNVKSHFRKIHPFNSIEVDEACKAASNRGKRRSLFPLSRAASPEHGQK